MPIVSTVVTANGQTSRITTNGRGFRVELQFPGGEWRSASMTLLNFEDAQTEQAILMDSFAPWVPVEDTPLGGILG